MIKINLLKSPVRKKVAHKPANSKLGLIVLIAVSLVIVLGSGAGTWWFITTHKKPVAEIPIVKKTDYKPTTHTNPNMVEDVVKEVGDENSKTIAAGFLDINYSEMSTAEKINYEALYAKYVTEMLGRAIPSGIGLKMLEIENFQSIYAVGVGSTRELVSDMLTSLKKERVELLPPPYSYIKANDGAGYRFVFTCKPSFGLDLSDPFQATDYLSPRDDLPLLLKKISEYASHDKFTLKGNPVQLTAEKVGSYHRLVYKFSGSCTYKDFVKFVLHLYKDRFPVAFKKMTLKARSGAMVDITAECLITTKE